MERRLLLPYTQRVQGNTVSFNLFQIVVILVLHSVIIYGIIITVLVGV